MLLVTIILDQPTIERRSLQIVNKSEKITLIRDIVSNPLSDASWYYGTQLLKTQASVKTATYTIENTTCTDTKNYTLVVSNGIRNTVTATVELIVNCEIFYYHFKLRRIKVYFCKKYCITVTVSFSMFADTVVVHKYSKFIIISNGNIGIQ